MLSCKETSMLISEGLDRKLPLRQRIALRIHLLMCSGCRACRRQLGALHRLIAERFKRDPSGKESSPLRLSEEARQKMKEALRK